MARVNLTKRVADTAKPGDYQIWDKTLLGFGLHVRPSGAKTYIVGYRDASGTTRRFRLGRHGVLAPEQARELARQALAAVARGEDPAAERDRKRGGATVAVAVERFLAEHVEPKRRASTAAFYRSTLALHVLPRLGSRRVEDVEPRDVAELHHKLRKTPTAANRVVAILSSLFSYCERAGLRPRGSNPCRGLTRFGENKRERFLSGEELARLGEVLAAAEREGSEHPSAILALRLLVLTGCRAGEVLNLRWLEVDFERGALWLARSKTGPRVVPLAAPALELLAAAPRHEGNDYVCAGRRPGGHFVGLFHVWERLRERAGLPGVRVHDLRHSFASVGAGAGLSLPVIGKLLGHQTPSMTMRYAHLSEDPLRAAADRIASEIAAHLDGARGATVVPLRGMR